MFDHGGFDFRFVGWIRGGTWGVFYNQTRSSNWGDFIHWFSGIWNLNF